MTLRMKGTQHNEHQIPSVVLLKVHYAECLFLVVKLSYIILNVVKMNVIMLNVMAPCQ